MSLPSINNRLQLPSVPQTQPNDLEELGKILFEEEHPHHNTNPFNIVDDFKHSCSFGNHVEEQSESEKNKWNELFSYDFNEEFSNKYMDIATLYRNKLKKPTIKLTKPQIDLNEMNCHVNEYKIKVDNETKPKRKVNMFNNHQKALEVIELIKQNQTIFNFKFFRYQVFAIKSTYEISSEVIGALLGVSYQTVDTHLKTVHQEINTRRKEFRGRPSIFSDLITTACLFFRDYCFANNWVFTISTIRNLMKTLEPSNEFQKETVRQFSKRLLNLRCVKIIPDDLDRIRINGEDILKKYEEIATYRHCPSSLVFNLDEIGFEQYADKRSLKVLVPEDRINNVKVGISRGKRTTVLTCICLDGTVTGVASIIPQLTIQTDFYRKYSDIQFYHSKTGFITKSIFVEWIKSIFIPTVHFKRTAMGLTMETTAILMLDNFTGHKDNEMDILFEKNNIKCVFFTPHTSHIVQPLDLVLFGNWKKQCSSSAIFRSEQIVSNVCDSEIVESIRSNISGTIIDSAATQTNEIIREMAQKNPIIYEATKKGNNRSQKGEKLSRYLSHIFDSFKVVSTPSNIVSSFTRSGILSKRKEGIFVMVVDIQKAEKFKSTFPEVHAVACSKRELNDDIVEPKFIPIEETHKPLNTIPLIITRMANDTELLKMEEGTNVLNISTAILSFINYLEMKN